MSPTPESHWHKVLIGRSAGTNAFRLKVLATSALAHGLRVVVLDPDRNWIAFADLFDGLSYALEPQVARISGQWRGSVPYAELSQHNCPIVLSFDDASREPGADFWKLCEFLSEDHHPHLLVIDGVSSMKFFEHHVGALLDASTDARVLASAIDADSAAWLQALAPGLEMVCCAATDPQGVAAPC